MKRQVWIISIAILFVANATNAQTDEKIREFAINCNAPSGSLAQAVAPYNQCMTMAARRLEPSGDSPEDIADAAKIECGSFYAEVDRIENACSSGYEALQLQWTGRATIDANTRALVAQAVLSKRAADARSHH